MKTLVNYGELAQRIEALDAIDPNLKAVLRNIIEAMNKEADNFANNALGRDDTGTVSTTFITADVPPKTMTISKGIITGAE